MKSSLALKSLTKSFGSSRGIENVNLLVKPGEIVGFLGPNGAGKTTTINMIMGFTKPTSGTVLVFGNDTVTKGTVARHKIGYLSNDMTLDEGLTGKQELAYLGSLTGSYDEQYMLELSKRLGAELDKKIRNLSRGNKQKIGLVSALMHKPDILILDEPTSGLDPLIQATFNAIILEHKNAGKAAFISSHVLSEVEEICDRFVFIQEGHIIADKTLAELRSQTAREITIQSSSSSAVVKILKSINGTDKLTTTGHTITCLFTGDINQLIKSLATHDIRSLSIQETDLEKVFMNYYENQEPNS